MFARWERRENHGQLPREHRQQVTFAVVVPREENVGELQENVARFVTNSPPVPALARRLERERQERQSQFDMELIPLNLPSPGNDQTLVSPSVDEGVKIYISLNDIEPKRSLRDGEQVEARRVRPQILAAVVEDPTLEWSLFQVWNNLAYATSSVPYRVVLDDKVGRYVLKRFRLQQLSYGLQTGAGFVDVLSWWRVFKSTIDGPSNPLKYIRFASLVIKVVSRLCQMKTVVFGMKDILRLHNLALDYEREASSYRIKMQKKTTIVFILGYGVYLIVFSSMSVALQMYMEEGNWEWGLAELLQWFACYSRRKYTWVTEEGCPQDIILSLAQIPFKEYFLGVLGVYTFISSILFEQHMTLQIMTSCLTLMDMSMALTPSSEISAIGNVTEFQTADNPRTRYHFVEKSARNISSFIGLLISVKIIDVACGMPKCLNIIFNMHSIIAAPLAINIVLLFLAFFAACISSLQIDELQDAIADPSTADAFPQDLAGLMLYLKRVYNKTVGIGYRSLLVLTFPRFLAYCINVGAPVAFTWDTEEKEAEKRERFHTI